MDYQVLFNYAVSILILLVGWWSRSLYDMVQEMRRGMFELERTVTNHYVKKEDYKEDLREIKALVQSILSRLDDKADRS